MKMEKIFLLVVRKIDFAFKNNFWVHYYLWNWNFLSDFLEYWSFKTAQKNVTKFWPSSSQKNKFFSKSAFYY